MNVYQWLHMKGGLKPHSSALKPVLTEQNKYSWLFFALEMIDPTDPTKSKDMYNYIHVDEKWFYLTRDHQRLILADKKLPPHCSVCHKVHKVMFLCAVACPLYSTATKQWWDGKLGIWPVGGWEQGK